VKKQSTCVKMKNDNNIRRQAIPVMVDHHCPEDGMESFSVRQSSLYLCWSIRRETDTVC